MHGEDSWKAGKDGTINTVELFAGPGGLGLGFEQAGYNVVAANDISADACATLRANRPHVCVVHGDIRSICVKNDVEHALRGRPCHVLIGGPACQGHSQAGHRRADDPRDLLVLDFYSMVSILRPVAFVMENVVGLRTKLHEGARVYNVLSHLLTQEGYSLHRLVLDAADFGVPQHRRRLFLVGMKKPFVGIDLQPTHGATGVDGLQPWVTVEQAIGDLVSLPDNPGFNHVRPRHSESIVKKIRKAQGGDGIYGQVRKTNRKLIPDRPAWTVMAANKGKFAHYAEPRLITGREAARLQGFPDDHRFVGSQASVREQIGNAVPPLLARAVAMAIRPAVFSMMNSQSEAVETVRTVA